MIQYTIRHGDDRGGGWERGGRAGRSREGAGRGQLGGSGTADGGGRQ